jgi:hypothetical protein
MRNVHQAEEEEVVDVKDQVKDLKPKKPPIAKEKMPKGKVKVNFFYFVYF